MKLIVKKVQTAILQRETRNNICFYAQIKRKTNEVITIV